MLNFSTGVIAQQEYNYYIVSNPTSVATDPIWLIEGGGHRPQVREIYITSNIREMDVNLYAEWYDPELDDPEDNQELLDAYGISIDKTSGSYDFTITATFTEPKDSQEDFRAEIVITSPYYKDGDENKFIIPVTLKSSWTPGGGTPPSEPHLIVNPTIISVYNQSYNKTITIRTNDGFPVVTRVSGEAYFVNIGSVIQDPNDDNKYTCNLNILANTTDKHRIGRLNVTTTNFVEQVHVAQTATSGSPGGGSGGDYLDCVMQCGGIGAYICIRQCMTYYGPEYAIE